MKIFSQNISRVSGKDKYIAALQRETGSGHTHVYTSVIILILMICSLQSFSQKVITLGNRNITYDYIKDGNDSMLNFYIREIIIFPSRRGTKKEARDYQLLVFNVKKVLPYARKAKDILIQINDTLMTFRTEHEKKVYIKKVDHILQDKFGDDLKKLSVNQGRILMKLIDRETGNTTFDIVKELRGTFSAYFWQSLALIFGSTMKSGYDPYGNEKTIEQIIIQIDNGQI